MSKVKEFGQMIADFLSKNDEEGAKTFIRDRLLQAGNLYNGPEDIERSVQWWLEETRKAMAAGLLAV